MKKVEIYLIFLLFFLFSLIIGNRLFFLQVKNGDYWQVIAKGQQLSLKESVGERGNFFLEDGEKILAQNIKRNIIYVFPEKIENKEETAEILEKIFNQPKEEILAELEKNQTFRKEISDEQFQEIKKQNIKGVSGNEIQKRIYPQNSLAASLIGFVNEEGNGQYGIEGYFDEILKGKQGFQKEQRAPLGYLTLFSEEDDLNPPQQGSNLILTLDYNIQFFSEKILKQAKEKWDIDSGEVIVAEPTTGRIISLATFPSFNPNQYQKETDFEIFRNGAVQKLFEPGSVFKPITMAAALEEDLITPETTYKDKGYVNVGGPSIYNYEKRVWGEQTMTNVLEKSINTGAIFVEQELGGKLFLKYLEKFGFFEKTKIDLQGEEFSSNETLRNGYPRDFATASFGQGVEITPIQLIGAFGAIANGGKLMRPYVVEKIIKEDGQEIEIQPEIQGEVISETTAAKLTSMLVSVVENGHAKGAGIDGYFIAGKTGTAQIPSKEGGYLEYETIQSFMGYFPAMNPRVLIFVKLNNPKESRSSAYSAVPLFRELAKYIIDLWQIPPDYE